MFQNRNNFGEMKEMKKNYESYPVPDEALSRIKAGILQAVEEENAKKIDVLYFKRNGERKMNRKSNRKNSRWISYGKAAGFTAAAAMAMVVVLANVSPTIAMAMEQIPVIGAITRVVTFRNYEYEDERNHAEVEVPGIIISEDENLTANVPEDVQDNLSNSVEEINAEISKIADEFVQEFEANLEKEWGYQDILVESEAVNSTQDYFTLKLVCYQGAGSGTVWNYYYTIDLTTGNRLALQDIFAEGADYITPISENIKAQMRQQMEADDSKYYWLEDEIEAWNFKQITEDTAFYINENGNVVISFNEGEVAPMYMGVVTFEIPSETVKDILK